MTPPIYLLTGETFLADEALDKIRAEVDADPLGEVGFDAGVGAAELVEALETPNLLGGTRLVTVRNANELKKDVREAIEAYLENPSESSVLVLVASGRSPLAKSVERAGAVVTLEAPRGRRLVSWLRERARARGIRLEDRGAWALVDAAGTELRDLDNALAQLTSAAGDGVVGAAEVRRAFPRLADERIYAFTDAVGERRLDVAMTALRRLLDQADAPLVVFGALVAHTRRLLLARSVAEGGTRAVADVLGLPEWRAKRVHAQARTYRQEELTAALEVLARTDVEMKGGDLSPEIALERAVIEIVSSGPRGRMAAKSPSS